MNKESTIVNIFKGLLRSIFVTLIGVFILSIIMIIKDLGLTTLYVLWIVITCISIVFGASYSARKNKSNGWLVGLIEGFFYYIVILVISLCMKEEFNFGLYDFYRMVIALAIGFFSGMLGINTTKKEEC